MEQVQRGKQWLEELLQLMATPAEVNIQVSGEENSEENWLIIDESNLTPEQVETLIGAHGANLDAMQYLANTLLNIGVDRDQQRPLTIELDGYRVRRQAELMAQVEQVAQQVRDTGEEQEIDSLSSAERRQVHNLLKDEQDLETESRGQEPNRRLVVKLRSL